MVSRSASAVATVLLSTMEEMKEEQEKKDKLVETKKEKTVVGQIPAGDKKEKEKEVPTVREKSSKEEKEKGGKRLITPEKPPADKKPKAISANPPREVLASLTNRFLIFAHISSTQPFAQSQENNCAHCSLVQTLY